MDREVLEFIIVPPFDRRHEITNSKERMEHYLGNRFPGYSFKLVAFAPVGDEDDFRVLPVMNFIDGEGISRMCAEPKRWMMVEIAQACHEFDANGRRSCAA
ncbi:hypothetical protein SAMN02982989_3381 [Xaviernesmea oryzae]|uniref:Uncharacterized protein n=1 Tax=Xaviernesmea oryzae TaxID=464029 RepID=A0A1X7G8B9_9HYPH|nr:hypothetical protein [Xaviernesmea oryzae]SMF65606.1 hypothetical protein SAMN02982989_3381 [Xaviernesmea oryzae]